MNQCHALCTVQKYPYRTDRRGWNFIITLTGRGRGCESRLF